MRAKGMGWGAARVLGVGCAALAVAEPALAQQVVLPSPPPAPSTGADIDPSAPLDPMPELGVDWPDLAAPDPTPVAEAPPPAEGTESEPLARGDAVLVDDDGAARRAMSFASATGARSSASSSPSPATKCAEPFTNTGAVQGAWLGSRP